MYPIFLFRCLDGHVFPFLLMFYYNYIGIAITIIHQIILVVEEYNLDCLHQRGVQKLSWLHPFIKHQQMTLKHATLLILSVLQDASLGMIFIQTTIFLGILAFRAIKTLEIVRRSLNSLMIMEWTEIVDCFLSLVNVCGLIFYSSLHHSFTLSVFGSLFLVSEALWSSCQSVIHFTHFDSLASTSCLTTLC